MAGLWDTAQAFHVTFMKRRTDFGARGHRLVPSYWYSGHRHRCLPVCFPRRAAWISLSPPLQGLVFETICSAWQVWFAFQAHISQVRPGDPLQGADTLSLSPHMPIHVSQKPWGSLQQGQSGTAGHRAGALRGGGGSHSGLEHALDIQEHQGGLRSR